MEYNFNIRIVVNGDDANELTEEQLTDFIKAELASGSYGSDNPLIHEDFDCNISYIEIS